MNQRQNRKSRTLADERYSADSEVGTFLILRRLSRSLFTRLAKAAPLAVNQVKVISTACFMNTPLNPPSVDLVPKRQSLQKRRSVLNPHQVSGIVIKFSLHSKF